MTNWIDKQSEAHLEATEWLSFGQEGFPDAVIFANDGSVLDGTYKQVRYIQEQRYQQLAEVAREMLKEIKTMAGSYGYTADLDYEHKYEWIEDCARPWREKLEELGVKL